MSERFQYLLDAAYKNGLFLNHKLERKCVDGVCGMYAMDSIESGELLASFPLSQLIKVDDSLYPQGTSNTAKIIHSAAQEFAKGDASKFKYVFSLFDSLDEIRECSTYFADEDDLSHIKSLGSGLYKEIQLQNAKNRSLIEALHGFDPSVNLNIYAMIALNYNSRAFGTNGFLPVIDCFNHSDEKGAFIDKSNSEQVSLSAKVDYQAGDQVFISYGVLDMFTHAINYNYYDSHNIHFIQFQKRFSFVARTENEIVLLKQLASRFKLSINRFAQGYAYAFLGNDIYFSETQPSIKLIEIAETIAQYAPFSSSPKDILAGFLKQLDAENSVEMCSKKSLPKRYARFYKLLRKEKQIIHANKNWLLQNL